VQLPGCTSKKGVLMSDDFENKYESTSTGDLSKHLEVESTNHVDAITRNPEINILFGMTKECKVTSDKRVISIEGLNMDILGGVGGQVGSSTKDLVAELLGIKPSSIKIVVKCLVDLQLGELQVVQTLSLPAQTEDQINATEMQTAMHDYVQLIGPNSSQHLKTLKEKEDVNTKAVIVAAAKFREAAAQKPLPNGMEISSKNWQQAIPLPSSVGDANRVEKIEIKKEAQGAFRGYFIEGRKAYFLVNCKLGKNPLHICFDEELFFEQVKKLSSRKFTHCTIRYIEHMIGTKLEHLQLAEIAGVSDDFFEQES
jgi:hypothetical protein